MLVDEQVPQVCRRTVYSYYFTVKKLALQQTQTPPHQEVPALFMIKHLQI